MLQALAQELSRIQIATSAATSTQQHTQAAAQTCSRQPGIESSAAQAFSRGSALFQRALQQLLSEGVKGCTKDAARALALKAAGNSSYSQGQHQPAAQHYSDALVWLPCRTQQAEATRVHANRAQCLLKLAQAAADTRAAQHLAAAAAEDCTAALSYCADSGLQHKVLFRRAKAQLLLHQHAAAAADCEAAAATPGAPAAAVRECRQLQQQIAAAAAAAATAAQAAGAACAAPAAATAVTAQSAEVQDGQEHQHQQQHRSPSLQQLDQLLRHHQQQAQLHLAQQQQQQQQQQGLACSSSSSTRGVQPTAVSLRCRLVPGKGRTLVAGSAIPPGTLLLAEMPLAAVPTKRGVAGSTTTSSSSSKEAPATCSWCFGAVPPWRVWPCEGCPLVLYCSTACRQAAAAAGCHAPGGIECGRPWVRLLPEEALLASRCLSAAAAGSGDGAAASPEQRQVALLTSLVHHLHETATPSSSDTTQPDEQQQQQLEQTVLAHLVAAIHRTAAAPAAPAAAAATPAAVLRCLQLIECNGIAIRPLLSAGDRWGCGLYQLTAALVNHSCDPNCSIRFSGRQLLLTCILGAAAGDELTISYGPQLGTQTTQQRQALLQRQYGFTCTCSACSNGLYSPPGSDAWSIDEIEAGLNGLRCCDGCGSKCKGAVVPSRMQLPSGIVSLHAYDTATASSGSSSQQPYQHCCVTCGLEMPDVLLSLKLQEMQSAAAVAEKGCQLMSQVEALQQQKQQQQSRQQQQQQKQQLLEQALQLLRRAAAMRQTNLHASNQLLGYSHHQAGAAAAAAAAGALALAAGTRQHMAPEEAVQAVKASLAMRSEEDVVDVLQRLQRLCGSQGSTSSSVVEALHMAGIAQVQDAVAGGLSVIRTACSQQALSGLQLHDAKIPVRGYLAAAAAAAGHLLCSVQVLCRSQQPGSLQLASEAAAACAACAGLVICGKGRDMCRRCSQLHRTVSVLHKHAAAEFALHMPGVLFNCIRPV